MDTEALEQHIVKCSCVTKTPEVKYHQPWCSYRQVAALKERIEALEAALIKLRDCDFVITPHDRMDAVREIARQALLPGRGDDDFR